jgi:TRAP-type C4-dicarboxylate transport system substrate-binding protein
MFNMKTLTAGAAALTMMASATFAETVIRVQSVLANSSDEVHMLKALHQTYADLTGGSLQIEILPAGAVVGPRDIIDAG